jgi:hypothetical protein
MISCSSPVSLNKGLLFYLVKQEDKKTKTITVIQVVEVQI